MGMMCQEGNLKIRGGENGNRKTTKKEQKKVDGTRRGKGRDLVLITNASGSCTTNLHALGLPAKVQVVCSCFQQVGR